ncbi:tetratricopeptide repeat protein, partial [Stenotrophomonas maltophilia]
MHNLAVIYAENPGPNGKPDFASAASWFRQAAEYGVRDSQYNLAVLYARGLGLSQDLVQSYAWFAASAAQGDTEG